MVRSKHWNALLLTVIVLGVLWIYVSRAPIEGAQASVSANPQAGFSSPDFTLTTLDGKALTLSDFKGKVVLINIWASWCGPCRAEMPAIDKVYRRYRDKNFTTLAVNTTYQDSEPEARAFVRNFDLSFPILLDLDGTVSRQYQVQALPTSFFVGKDGIIREVVFGGSLNEALIASKIEALLAEANQ